MGTRKSALGIGNNICNGPEVEMNIAHMKNGEKTSMGSQMGCNMNNGTGEVEILTKHGLIIQRI